MNILAIDTSNQVMSTAVLNGDQLIAEYTTNVKKNHSVALMPAIDSILRDAGITPGEIHKIVVARGPGSYTGVRIGVTTAKTLAWTLNIPITGVSSLEAAAYNGFYFPGLICSFFDARRGRVFAAVYKRDGKQLIPVLEEKNIQFTDWLQELKSQKEQVLFIGNNFSLHRENIQELLGDQAVIAEAYMHIPRASVLGHIGKDRDAEDLHSFTPHYLRLAEAEAKWLQTRGNGHE